MFSKIENLTDYLCAWIQRLLPENKLDQMQKVQVGKDRELLKREYARHLLKYLFVILIIICLLGILSVFAVPQKSVLKQGHLLERQAPYGESSHTKLEMDIAGNHRDIMVEVPPREYTAEEQKAKFEEAKQYILKHYLGENRSADQICKDLDLFTEIPESAIELEWQLDSGQLVGESGSIQWDLIEDTVQVEITAILRYGENSESMPLELTLLPLWKSKEEKLWAAWQKEQSVQEEKTKEEQYLSLPEQIDGQAVSYRETRTAIWKYILLFGIIILLLFPLVLDSRLRQKLAYREKELRLDYPEILEQFVLLIGAGLSIRGAWQKIALEYQKQYGNGDRKYRFVYEEMLVTMREMEGGMGERKAYELFGKRIGIISYMRFSTLLVQNLRKGSADLLRILEYESVDAFRERKENAKALGEEASTKLLMPMMLMLVVVLVMIIYAAFCSM